MMGITIDIIAVKCALIWMIPFVLGIIFHTTKKYVKQYLHKKEHNRVLVGKITEIGNQIQNEIKRGKINRIHITNQATYEYLTKYPEDKLLVDELIAESNALLNNNSINKEKK